MTGPPLTDDETLLRLRHADAAGAAQLRALADGDAEIAARLAAWDRQDAALHALYDPAAEAPIASGHKDLIAAAAGRQPLSDRKALRIAALLGMLAIGLVSGFGAAQLRAPQAAPPDLATAALRAYATYSVEPVHPVEVPATDAVHLASWLSNRVGIPITPPDLTAQGFMLMGGRVLPDATGTAALVMYQDSTGQRLTLYITRESAGAEPGKGAVADGAASGVWWVDNQIGCVAVGEIEPAVLRSVARAAYVQLSANPTQ